MPSTTRPCPACQSDVPQLHVEAAAFDSVVRALSGGSKTMVALELMHFACCSEREAHAWVNHLLSCVAPWPHREQDELVLAHIDRAFHDVGKPEHFTDFAHCTECAEHDQTLRSRTRSTLRREDLGNVGWDPISFCSAEGMGYYFPTLARYALLPDAWPDHSWYGEQLPSHLRFDWAGGAFFQWCTPAQRAAVAALVRHLAQTRANDLSARDSDDLAGTLQAWDAAAKGA